MGPLSQIGACLRHASDRPAGYAWLPTLAVLVAVLAVAAAVLLLRGDDSAPPVAQPAPPPSVTVAPLMSPPPAAVGVPSRRDLLRAKVIARRFLRGYLAFTYGERIEITGATGSLRQRLADTPLPRVPPAERRRTPRITRLVIEDGAQTGRATVGARVDDRERVYIVRVELERVDGRWLASDVVR